MSLHQEILQLCKAILSFENDISELKQKLFNYPIVTKQLLWNHMIGGSIAKAQPEMIQYFFEKHGLNISQEDLRLIAWQYSSRRDDCLSLQDLWRIFKPLTMKMTDEIMQVREKKFPLARCHQAPFQITDLLVEIMSKTVVFLKSSQQMKWNIVKADAQKFDITPMDTAQQLIFYISLQIYLNRNEPQMIKKQVQIVLKHLMGNNQVCLKTLQQYFIPIDYKGSRFNPNYVRQGQTIDQLQGIELLKYHHQNIHYVTKLKWRKPCYLDGKQLGKTADSL